ncbi:bifunctional folylpolyglutamate synthase/dihydrofolate synthase [Candidatus Woesearchaeota archaeon]|nr:bifunctional folylpolyglutamate synthase/dihydrofolate synthase [Candidatus Woesearchaeota archaeon]
MGNLIQKFYKQSLNNAVSMKNISWLYSLEGRGSVLGLDRVRHLLDKLGNPHENLTCIHVAGTNGKGSVCAILSSILKHSGFKVGMYTSPHLKRFTERFQLNSREILEEDVESLIQRVRPFVTDQTFFEVATAMAFLYFAGQDVDFLVLEVGLGGRLDATNVINPLVSIITNISLEHTQVLGETEEQIAYEKAGIIKQNVPVVTLAAGKPLRIIKKIAAQNNSELFIPKYRRKDGTFDINSYKGLGLSLKGDFQMDNASLAITALKVLKNNGYEVSSDSIKQGLQKAYWPGRMEFIGKNILVDCAHNPDAVSALKKEIEKVRKNYAKVISVVGIMKDKDKETMVRHISSFSDYMIFTRPKISRASMPEELASYTAVKREIVYDVKKALKKAKRLAYPDDLIVVTGSVYTVGEVG